MCAAPGGKTFCLLQALLGASGTATPKKTILQANEWDATRRKRLATVLREYIPTTHEINVHITALDAGKRGSFMYEHFDRILLDAPCSAERHLLNDEKELMGSWKKTRPANHAKLQVALLTEGLNALAPGGRLVYATCALTEMENDQVVKRVLDKLSKRHGHAKDSLIDIERKVYKIGEPTLMGGWMVLPDTAGGYGPLYFCSMLKRASFGAGGGAEEEEEEEEHDKEHDDDDTVLE